EAAETLLGDVEAAFDWRVRGPVRFHIRTKGAVNPIVEVLGFLDVATVSAEFVENSKNEAAWISKWGSLTEVPREQGYPFPDPQSPATLVCRLVAAGKEIRIDHWGDVTRDNVKFWAGAGGYPGASLARDALELIRGKAVTSREDPFNFSVPQTSSFRLDWRRDYIPLDAGFSLNEHKRYIKAKGFP